MYIYSQNQIFMQTVRVQSLNKFFSEYFHISVSLQSAA